MKNWVVLFARTGSEEKLVQTLKEQLDAEKYLPFVPTKEMPYRSRVQKVFWGVKSKDLKIFKIGCFEALLKKMLGWVVFEEI